MKKYEHINELNAITNKRGMAHADHTAKSYIFNIIDSGHLGFRSNCPDIATITPSMDYSPQSSYKWGITPLWKSNRNVFSRSNFIQIIRYE